MFRMVKLMRAQVEMMLHHKEVDLQDASLATNVLAILKAIRLAEKR